MLAQRTKEISYPEQLTAFESFSLRLPQVECPVIHHFGPGIYIREVHIPAGSFAVGHAQRYEQLNIMLAGVLAVTDDNGELKIMRAPFIFTGQPGRKFGYVIEDVIWQNVYATDERDIDVLESTYLDKSDEWTERNEEFRKLRVSLHNDDRADFGEIIERLGLTEEEVRLQSENESDQIPMPDGYKKFTVRGSFIEGRGAFASATVQAGEIIAPARLGGMRTPAGRYTNHSKAPNSRFETRGDDIYLIANKEISGCVGSDQGEEITIDYCQALALSGVIVERCT